MDISVAFLLISPKTLSTSSFCVTVISHHDTDVTCGFQNASRPGPPPQGPDGPFSPQGFPPPPPHFGGYYPPGQFGRGYGPPPGGFGPGPGFGPYGPPPPGYFGGPPGQGFPPGPPGRPGFHQQPPIGPPGQRPPQQHPQHSQQPSEGNSVGPAPASVQTSELPVDNKAPSATSAAAPPKTAGNAAGSEKKEPQPEKKKPAAVPTMASVAAAPAPKSAPTGPKNNRVAPAVPFTVNQKSFTPPVQPSTEGPLASTNGSVAKAAKPQSSQAAMEEAARQAKEAVAAAMAKLNPQAATAQAKPVPSGAAVDALSQRVSALSTSTVTDGAQRGGRGGSHRAGRGGTHPRGAGPAKRMEIPKSDFDFESANAKFNKEDLIKEAIATGSPPVAGAEETPLEVGEKDDSVQALQRKDSLPSNTGAAYNKSSSFFDNISSEAKDRVDANEARTQGRQLRSEEFKKNVETFGQGNVDGGFRGRGRGGGYGRGRGYGGYRGGYNSGNSRGGNGGYRGTRGRVGQGHGQVPASEA